ncbi:hypothetical protein V2P24_00110 [Mycoplasma putrefaciens]|uniref:hypothetical protein n=1 Tax=Mycoplasma putrefaciens TaxID=2123 RepID=UPI003DA26AF2
MLYRRKKYLKKYFQKYIDIESLYSIRPNNIREIIFYFLLYIAALSLPFLFLESLFLDRSSLESITILWKYFWFLLVPSLVSFFLSLILFIITIKKFSKIFTTSFEYKKELLENQVKKVIKENEGVNTFYKLEILYKNNKTSNPYINSGFWWWRSVYQRRLNITAIIMKITNKIKITDESSFIMMIGYNLVEFIDYFTRRIMFLRNRKLVKFEDYSILVNGSKQITFDEIGEYLISNYLYYVDKNIKKIFPEQE